MIRKAARGRGRLFGLALLLILLTLSILLISKFHFKGHFDGRSRFTIAIQNIHADNPISTYDLIILSVEPSQKRGVYLLIKNNSMLDIPYGYKTYPVYSIYRLGQLDEKRSGGKLLKKSIETTFGIKTDRYLLLREKNLGSYPQNKEELLNFKHDYFSFLGGFSFFKKLLFNLTETDLSFLERYRFWNAMRKLRVDQITIINLTDTNAISLEQLPDNTKVYLIDQSTFDYIISDNFQDVDIRKEEVNLEVVNATGQERVAAQFGRILEHLGANVIFKTTAKKEAIEACQLIFYTDTSRQSKIASILQRDYNCGEAKDITGEAQSNIKVIIGQGFLK